MKFFQKTISILTLSTFGLFLSIVQAETYYVSSVGNNTANGLTINNAWATIQYAANQVVAGDSVVVADGTYAGFNLTASGTSGNMIRFIALGGGVVIDSPNSVTIDGINLEGADWIEINGFKVINQPRNGIRVVHSDDCIVRNNYCDNNFERGIFTGFSDRILIENNTCLNSIDEHGIYFSKNADDPIIRNNICHHNNGAGIQINADISQGGDGITTGAQIYGNVLYEN
jgi:parallel beta-helix repeat protein